MLILSGLLALALAVVHVAAGYLRSLRGERRSLWLSAAGGASVAYVFVVLLPELDVWQRTMEEVDSPIIYYIEHHVYVMALLGLMVFYGLEWSITGSSRLRNRGGRAGNLFYQTHLGAFALYNALIGYLLLHPEVAGVRNLVLFTLAMALHFLVNDYGLRQHHSYSYDHTGRWILAAAVVAGWGLGLIIGIGDVLLAALFTFLAGALILNVLKEELPEERESRFWAFAVGAVLYTLLAQFL